MSEQSRLGRNDRCPKCRQKVKRCECKVAAGGGNPLWKVIAILVVGLGAWFVTNQHKEESARPEQATQLKTVFDHYMNRHAGESTWWLTDSTTNQFAEMRERIDRQKKVVAEALEKYRNVSPLAKQIAERFSNFSVSLAQGGHTMTITPGTKDSQAIKELQQAKMEVCFVPRTEKGMHPSSLYYKKEWEAVVIYGIKWPKKVFPALLYHELGHGLASKESWPSSMAPDGSRSYASEEVQMHDVEDKVLDAATNGEYHAKLNSLLERTKPRDWRSAVYGLTLADLKELDNLLGCTNDDAEVANIIAVQYQLSLGFRFIERSAMEKAEQDKAKLALYQFLRETYR